LTPTQQRERLRALMVAAVENDRGWVYLARRPLPLATEHQVKHGTVKADCSYAIKDLCRLVPGVPDPTGRRYDRYGNSISMWGHLKHVAFTETRAGDIVLFGRQGGIHASFIYSKGKTTSSTKAWSNGSRGGPKIMPLSWLIESFPAGTTVTYCLLLPLPTLYPAEEPWYENAVAADDRFWSWAYWRDHGSPSGAKPDAAAEHPGVAAYLRYWRYPRRGEPAIPDHLGS
jgi:hypothetical protein